MRNPNEKRTSLCAPALILLTFLSAAPPRLAQEERKPGVGYYYMQGRAAYQKKDYQAFLDNFKKANEVAPGHLEAIYYLARAHALSGNRSEAAAVLNRMLDMGITMDLEANADFNPIRSSEEFKSISKKIERVKAPVANSRVAFTLPDKELIPEGMAYDPATETFYLGSIYKRKIFRISKDGKYKDFKTEGQDGLWGVLGMKVDAGRRVLWVNSAAGPEEKGFNGYSGVFKYDLVSGKLIKKYVLENKPESHLFNDLVITAQGDAFLTDSLSGAVYMIHHERDGLEVFLQPGRFIYPNGIAISDDNKTLYVADWSAGISVVDVGTRSVTTMAHPDNITLSGVDGLYFYKNSLVAVQNGPKPERVIQYFLDGGLARVKSATVIEANNPVFDIPTTGAIAGDGFYYIANSHVDSLKDGVLVSASKLRNVTILKAALKGRG